MVKEKVMRKPLPPETSWWSERQNLLTSLKPKHVRARPKKAKAKPKSIKAKKPVKAKKVTKMKKATKAKKGKAKRTK